MPGGTRGGPIIAFGDGYYWLIRAGHLDLTRGMDEGRGMKMRAG
ncbi:MAG: hypothetical protein AB7I37_14250 [Pirellulales bacterium]